MNKAPVKVAQVDVFTAAAYSGNPAAVCFLSDSTDDRWMADVAREMACTNTAFVSTRTDGDGFNLRWYTAGGIEVALCGHATLATAHLLFERGEVPAGAAVSFHTKSGLLVASRRADGAIEMDFPAEPAVAVEAPPAAIHEGLGIKPKWIGRNRFDYVVEVESEVQLRALRPVHDILATVETRGFVVTARADVPTGSEYDYVLRFFGPRVGVPEDLVTGTAHCALAPFWHDRSTNGQSRFTAFQASARGGLVAVELRGDRVAIAGKAVTVMRGELLA